MLSATRVIAAAAVLTVGSGLVLSGLVRGPGDGMTPPGAQAQVDVPDDWAFFTGTLRYDGRSLPHPPYPPDEEFAENGLIVSLNSGWQGQTFETTDPRMTGRRLERDSGFDDLAGGASIWKTLDTIENEGGTWSCSLIGLSNGPGDVQGGWCEGAGAYDGLRAYLVINAIEDSGPMATVPVMGFISNGDGPPAPDPVSS